MTGGVVAALAGAVAATSWDASPAAVRDRVVDLVADCVAVSALGSGRPELDPARPRPRRTPPKAPPR